MTMTMMMTKMMCVCVCEREMEDEDDDEDREMGRGVPAGVVVHRKARAGRDPSVMACLGWLFFAGTA